MNAKFYRSPRVVVHPRVWNRHPELSEDDIESALRNSLQTRRRVNTDNDAYVSVGFDAKGRFVEMVYTVVEGGVLIYHAMIPPSKKTMRELGLRR